MNKRKLDDAVKHARITVTEVQSDSLYYDPGISVRPSKRTDYAYTIHIGNLNSQDMEAFMNWLKEVKPDWLEGIEQGYNDGWNWVK